MEMGILAAARMDTLGRKMNGPKPATSKFMLEIRRFVTVGEVMF